MYFTYILYSELFDRYYVGHCEDMGARLLRHNQKKVTSTKPYVPWKVVYIQPHSTRAEASSMEMAIKKKKSRVYIKKIIPCCTTCYIGFPAGIRLHFSPPCNLNEEDVSYQYCLHIRRRVLEKTFENISVQPVYRHVITISCKHL